MTTNTMTMSNPVWDAYKEHEQGVESRRAAVGNAITGLVRHLGNGVSPKAVGMGTLGYMAGGPVGAMAGLMPQDAINLAKGFVRSAVDETKGLCKSVAGAAVGYIDAAAKADEYAGIEARRLVKRRVLKIEEDAPADVPEVEAEDVERTGWKEKLYGGVKDAVNAVIAPGKSVCKTVYAAGRYEKLLTEAEKAGVDVEKYVDAGVKKERVGQLEEALKNACQDKDINEMKRLRPQYEALTLDGTAIMTLVDKELKEEAASGIEVAKNNLIKASRDGDIGAKQKALVDYAIAAGGIETVVNMAREDVKEAKVEAQRVALIKVADGFVEMARIAKEEEDLEKAAVLVEKASGLYNSANSSNPGLNPAEVLSLEIKSTRRVLRTQEEFSDGVYLRGLEEEAKVAGDRKAQANIARMVLNGGASLRQGYLGRMDREEGVEEGSDPGGRGAKGGETKSDKSYREAVQKHADFVSGQGRDLSVSNESGALYRGFVESIKKTELEAGRMAVVDTLNKVLDRKATESPGDHIKDVIEKVGGRPVVGSSLGGEDGPEESDGILRQDDVDALLRSQGVEPEEPTGTSLGQDDIDALLRYVEEGKREERSLDEALGQDGVNTSGMRYQDDDNFFYSIGRDERVRYLMRARHLVNSGADVETTDPEKVWGKRYKDRDGNRIKLEFAVRNIGDALEREKDNRLIGSMRMAEHAREYLGEIETFDDGLKGLVGVLEQDITRLEDRLKE